MYIVMKLIATVLNSCSYSNEHIYLPVHIAAIAHRIYFTGFIKVWHYSNNRSTVIPSCWYTMEQDEEEQAVRSTKKLRKRENRACGLHDIPKERTREQGDSRGKCDDDSDIHNCISIECRMMKENEW